MTVALVLSVWLCGFLSAIVVVLRHIPEAFELLASMQCTFLVGNAGLRQPGAPFKTFTSQPHQSPILLLKSRL